jgi:hypothetical protein
MNCVWVDCVSTITNISSAVTYVNNLSYHKIKITRVLVAGLRTLASVTLRSPDDTKISHLLTATGVELWVIELRRKKIDRSYGQCQYPFSWLNDNATILVKCFPKTERLYWMQKIYQLDRLFRMVPNLKTESNMLKNKNDEVNFENIMTSELYKVTLDGFFQNRYVCRESFSPDGNYIMLTTIKTILLYRSFRSISVKIGDL